MKTFKKSSNRIESKEERIAKISAKQAIIVAIVTSLFGVVAVLLPKIIGKSDLEAAQSKEASIPQVHQVNTARKDQSSERTEDTSRNFNDSSKPTPKKPEGNDVIGTKPSSENPFKLDEHSPAQASTAAANQSYLFVDRIEFRSGAQSDANATIRIIANVNGTKYAYPVSRPWAQVNEISNARILIPFDERYMVTFELQWNDGGTVTKADPIDNSPFIFSFSRKSNSMKVCHMKIDANGSRPMYLANIVFTIRTE